MTAEYKDALTTYLRGAREAMLWKLDGLSERDLRLPRTPTGFNLLGMVKHALHTEVVYFGRAFAREWSTPTELVPPDGDDVQADWYATPAESASGLIDLYRRVQTFADRTIADLSLDSVGTVEHWGGVSITLHEALVHVTVDLQRHAGQADVVRELIDGATGLLPAASNLPDDVDWEAYVRKLTAVADTF